MNIPDAAWQLVIRDASAIVYGAGAIAVVVAIIGWAQRTILRRLSALLELAEAQLKANHGASLVDRVTAHTLSLHRIEGRLRRIENAAGLPVTDDAELFEVDA